MESFSTWASFPFAFSSSSQSLCPPEARWLQAVAQPQRRGEVGGVAVQGAEAGAGQETSAGHPRVKHASALSGEESSKYLSFSHVSLRSVWWNEL